MQHKDMILNEDWYVNEFIHTNFGDQRLDTRLMQVTHQLSSQPNYPINQACENWQEAKAAYRFFRNDKVSSSLIMESHLINTAERAKEFPVVLAIEDTTYLNYTHHPETKGLGLVSKTGTSNKDILGLVMHTTMMVTTEGLPLGLIDQDIWARKKTNGRKSRLYKNQPFEKKESFKWVKSLNATSEILSPSDTTVVTVGDRECDIYEFLSKGRDLGAFYLVRSSNDRILEGSPKLDTNTMVKTLKNMPSQGQVEIEVPTKKNKNLLRTAVIDIRYCEIELRPPKRYPKAQSEKLSSVKTNVIWLSEQNPPKFENQINWRLLTNTPVNNLEDALEKVSWYCHRWSIENFHRVLKSGCRVQDCRLSTADRLEKYLTLMSIVAWRIYLMVHINRHVPDDSCEAALTKDEWKALYCRVKKTKKPPDKPPTLREAIHWIAQLGGFLSRKSDGEPGMTTIWRGWQRLQDITATWVILQSG